MTARVAALVLCAALGLSAWPVAAQEAAAQFTFTPALDGWHRPGFWTTGILEVRNPGSELHATATLLLDGDRTRYARSFTVPRGGRMRVEIPALVPHLVETVLVRVDATDSGERLWSQEVVVFGRRAAGDLVVFVGRSAPALVRALTTETLEETRPPWSLASLAVTALPADARALAAVQAIVFADLEDGTLTPEQAAAVADYVRLGGNLLYHWGVGWHPDRSVEAVLPAPVDVDGVGTMLLPSATETPVPASLGPCAIVTTRAGAVDALSRSQPTWLVRRGVGFGLVTFVGLDFSRPPWRERVDLVPWWERILAPARRAAPPPTDPWGDAPLSAGMEFAALKQSLGEGAHGRWFEPGWLIALIMIYGLLLGPGTYLLFRRQRRGLAAMAVPLVLIAVFTLLSAALSGVLHGGQSFARVLARIDVAADGTTQGRAWSLCVLPHNQRVALSASAPDAWLAPFPPDYEQGMFGSDHGWSKASRLVQLDAPKPGLDLPLRGWTPEGGVAQWIQHGSPQIQVIRDVDPQDRATSRARGRVVNGTGRPLYSAAFVSAEGVHVFGRPLPEGVTTFDLANPGHPRIDSLAHDLLNPPAQEEPHGPSIWGNALLAATDRRRAPTDRDGRGHDPRVVVPWSDPELPCAVPRPPSGRWVFYAWALADDPAIVVSELRAITQALVLYRVEVD